jgi:hypothetical protein
VNQRNQVFVSGFLTSIDIVLLTACSSRPQPGGTAWRAGAFDSNGEGNYFTTTSDGGAPIPHTGGAATGMMMGGGTLACASCHSPDGRGGVHIIHMQTDALYCVQMAR